MKKILILIAAVFLFSSCTENKVLVFKRGSSCNQHEDYVGYKAPHVDHAPKADKRKSY